MSTTKKLNDPSVTMVTEAPAASTVPIFDSSGKLSGITVGDLLAQVHVGGVNLLKGTQYFTGWTPKSGGVMTQSNRGCLRVAECPVRWSGMFILFTFQAGREYTLSLYSDKGSRVNPTLNYGAAQSVLGIATTAVLTQKKRVVEPMEDGWYRHSVSGLCTTSGVGMIEVEYAAETGSAQFCGVKLEHGNVATDWSPAPEDILERLAALENRGGVKYCLSVAYQKGGRHEHYKTAYQRPAQRNHDRHGGNEKWHIESGQSHDCRNVSGCSGAGKSRISGRGVQVRGSRGVPNTRVCHAGLLPASTARRTSALCKSRILPKRHDVMEPVVRVRGYRKSEDLTCGKEVVAA